MDGWDGTGTWKQLPNLPVYSSWFQHAAAAWTKTCTELVMSVVVIRDAILFIHRHTYSSLN